jgi:hypothetical protein
MSTPETEVKAAASAEVASLKSRITALEAKGEGYVKAHVVYFVGALCLVVGVIAGHVFK